MATAARLAVRQLLRASQAEASQATRTFKSSAAPRKVHYVSCPPRAPRGRTGTREPAGDGAGAMRPRGFRGRRGRRGLLHLSWLQMAAAAAAALHLAFSGCW